MSINGVMVILRAFTWSLPQTAGGIVQQIATKPGMTYQLKFDAFSGDWDGKDVDVVEVRAGTQEQSFAIVPSTGEPKNPNVASG